MTAFKSPLLKSPLLKSNGARHPMHMVRKADRQQPGAAFEPAASGRGPAGHLGRMREPVSLAPVPSLSRDIGLTVEDGGFMHAVRLAAEAMLEGAEERAS
jgi:hypothetical protein